MLNTYIIRMFRAIQFQGGLRHGRCIYNPNVWVADDDDDDNDDDEGSTQNHRQAIQSYTLHSLLVEK
jgi:hypothetical protein